jgi:hypothetical protein
MNNYPDNKPRKYKTFSSILLILTLSIIAYFIFLMFYFPVRQLSVFNNDYADSLLFKGEEKEIIRDDSIASLKIKEAFLQSRITMAKSDSISFSVDLIDSLLFLEVKGVVVLEAKIQKIAKSRFFSRVDNEPLIKYLSQPFIVSDKSATIEKEPIVFKKAPKDTIEAARQVFKPDTMANEIICINIEFDKNLILEISQSEEKPEFKNLNYLIKKRSWNFVQVAKKSFSFKEPYYTPKIIIELPKKDVKSIYRALPYKPQMSLIL